MAKCSITSSSSSLKDSGSLKTSKPGKVKRRPPGGRANLQQRFVPAQILDYVPQITGKALEEGACPTPLGFVSREGLMPDLAMVHGRMLVCAWETGLADVQDTAVKLLMLALETQLKNILSQVVRQRKGYHLRENKFVYAAGVGVKNPFSTRLRQVTAPAGDCAPTVITAGYAHTPALRPSKQAGEDIAAEQEALGAEFSADHLDPISLYDLADTLHLHKSCIPSHSVCAPAMERIVHSLWHPSVEELAQEDIHLQENRLKHKLAQRQLHGSEEIV
ncbi:transcriptional adapter 1-like protein [Elysia marginata]|uniref:Transcriptional adapter 1-like protein n=1 Tax=Elysia marginata TaxID=1093978 RepID=A0AAV4GUK7_9GAST|nr:transcriptional adapter 1-like protein [Elysia marginata]